MAQKGKELFTTLTTTTRKLTLGKKDVLISDTVGFISKLPAYLIEAFKSTLEELLYTDVILVVIDSSDAQSDLKKKFQSCTKTLYELGVERDKMIFVLNKSDLLEPDEIMGKVKYLKIDDSKKWINVSSKTGENVKQLEDLISKMLELKKPLDTKSRKEELDKIYGF